MQSATIVAPLILLGAWALAAPAIAADKTDVGKRQFDMSCASCHGVSGKGDGPMRPYLTVAPSDLTVLSKMNGGVFPLARVQEVIDGRTDVRAHGSREMPVWGARYNAQAADYYFDTPYDPEAYVRGRILVLTDYLYRIQVK